MAYGAYVKSLGRRYRVSLREKKKAETSARLMQAARRSFFSKGYAQTSMDDLCADAGVTRGALYHNFGGKDGLFEAVVRQLDEEIGERLLSVAGEDVTLEAFTATCIAYLECALDPEVQQIMFKDGPAVLGQRLRDIDKEGSIDPLKQAITELQGKGILKSSNPTALSVMLNGAMIDAALWIAGSEDTEKALQAASETLKTIIAGMS